MTTKEERKRNRLEQQENKKWNRIGKQQSSRRSKLWARFFGSSQIKHHWWGYSQRTAIAEMLARDVYEHVFSGQPDKLELSRHIGNRLAKFVDLYAEHRTWGSFDYYTKGHGASYVGTDRLSKHVRMGAQHYAENYDKLQAEALVALKQRDESIKAQYKLEREIGEAAWSDDRLRALSAVSSPHPEVTDGGGTSGPEGGSGMPEEGSAAGA